MAAASQPLTGKRVLLVEDETLVAMMIEEVIKELGCEVVGPISRIEAAKALIEQNGLDCALLDINLRGKAVYPLAELLTERAVPFGFVTGYGKSDVAAKFADCPVLHKPFNSRDLAAVLTRLTQAGRKPKPAHR